VVYLYLDRFRLWVKRQLQPSRPPALPAAAQFTK
jgi:hypothetical protein